MTDTQGLRLALDEIKTDELRFPRAALVEVGPATWTLGAMYRLCSGRRRSTFARLEYIAEMACLPAGKSGIRACIRHLRKLEQHGWVEKCGRENGRRTVTWALTTKAAEQLKPWASCPRWAIKICVDLGLEWAAVASLASLLSVETLVEALDETNQSSDHYREVNVSRTARHAGLGNCAARNALRSLLNIGLLQLNHDDDDDDGDGDDDDDGRPELTINAELYLRPDDFPGSCLTRAGKPRPKPGQAALGDAESTGPLPSDGSKYGTRTARDAVSLALVESVTGGGRNCHSR
jgi:hypothetical protein